MLLKNEALQYTNPLETRFSARFSVQGANLGLVGLQSMIDLNGKVFKVFFYDTLYYDSVTTGNGFNTSMNNSLIKLKTMNFSLLNQTQKKILNLN